MMENKSLLEFLDEVAREKGYNSLSQLAMLFGFVEDYEETIKEAGKRYVKQYLEAVAENAMIIVKDIENGVIEETMMAELAFAGDESPARVMVSQSSITNTEIDV